MFSQYGIYLNWVDMKTAEKILEKLTGESIDTLRNNYVSMDVILQAMEEYAQQIELPSEKVIAEWAYDETQQNINGDYERGIARGKEIGAKWAVKWIKDRIK